MNLNFAVVDVLIILTSDGCSAGERVCRTPHSVVQEDVTLCVRFCSSLFP